MRRAPSAVGDVVGHRLGRVGVEGADDAGRRRPSAAFQPTSGTSGSWTWTTSKSPRRSSRRGATTPPAGKGARLETDAVGAEAHRAPQRDQVVGHLARSPAAARCSDPADPAGRVEGGEHADVVAAAEELLGERLDVPVHAALVGPGIWRDESYAHEQLRVDHRPAADPPAWSAERAPSAQAKPRKTSR